MPKSAVRTLYVLRHAHAEANSADGSDFSRPLSSDGHKEARRMGKFLRQSRLAIDAVISSDAARATQTAEDALDGAKLKLPIRAEHRIYEAAAEDLLAVLRQADASAMKVLLVGHNPGAADLVSLLTSPAGLGLAFSPATLAAIEFEGPWSALTRGGGSLRALIPVKVLD